jgi:NADPH:quinone reductase-like Zn-dependent oxidoreductase
MLAGAETPDGSHAIEALAVRLNARAEDLGQIRPSLERLPLERYHAGDALIEIRAAAVNPSDAKAALGLMPYAVFPRTPGRDFAGVVLQGPPDLIGEEVFGSSGDLGIRRDGTHASHVVVEAEAIVRKPAVISLEEAAGIGVPFVTAAEGFRRAGLTRAGETVVILGVNGKVGQAAAQIAAWHGAQVIGVVRRDERYAGHACAPVTVLDASTEDVPARVKTLTDGRGADIVFNTVGEPYYTIGTGSLGKLGRQIFIASQQQDVAFDIFAFYRGRHTYVGIDTLALSSVETAAVLRDLLPGFASGQLRPFRIAPSATYPLAEAGEAFRRVMGSSRDRVVLVPEPFA